MQIVKIWYEIVILKSINMVSSLCCKQKKSVLMPTFYRLIMYMETIRNVLSVIQYGNLTTKTITFILQLVAKNFNNQQNRCTFCTKTNLLHLESTPTSRSFLLPPFFITFMNRCLESRKLSNETSTSWCICHSIFILRYKKI